MKTLTQVALMASLAFLLCGTGYATGPAHTSQVPYSPFPPMVLPVAGPAVENTPAFRHTPAATAEPQSDLKQATNSIVNIFAKAKEAFVRMDLKLAALEVRRGAASIRSEESRATPDIKKELAATALDLEMLALRIEQDKVKAGSDLDTAFARADHTLAEHNRQLARGPATLTTPASADQGMPIPRESVNAAYAPPEKRGEAATPTYEELNRRIDVLSKEVSLLREDLGRLKTQETATAK